MRAMIRKTRFHRKGGSDPKAMTKSNPSLLCEDVSRASALLRVLANPHRLALVCYLLDNEVSVSALEEVLGIRQPTLSQQLGELREHGVIASVRRGRFTVYRVVDPYAVSLVRFLRGMYRGLHDVTGRRDMGGLPLDEAMFDG